VVKRHNLNVKTNVQVVFNGDSIAFRTRSKELYACTFQQLPCTFLVFEKARGGHLFIQKFSPTVKIKVPTK